MACWIRLTRSAWASADNSEFARSVEAAGDADDQIAADDDDADGHRDPKVEEQQECDDRDRNHRRNQRLDANQYDVVGKMDLLDAVENLVRPGIEIENL